MQEAYGSHSADSDTPNQIRCCSRGSPIDGVVMRRCRNEVRGERESICCSISYQNKCDPIDAANQEFRFLQQIVEVVEFTSGTRGEDLCVGSRQGPTWDGEAIFDEDKSSSEGCDGSEKPEDHGHPD